MSFKLAIVGRPNVGKSTLFNRLVGKRLALVDDQPGVTRDLREGEARLGDLRFTVIDTAGLETATDDSLPARMRRLTERAVEDADACLFLIDARQGVTPADEIFADILRRRAGHVIVAANKAEGRSGEAGLYEAWSLGLGEPIALSAEHGEGLGDLAARLEPLIEAKAAAEAAGRAEADAAESDAERAERPETDVALTEKEAETGAADARHRITPARPLQIAVIGRPNAGKSTLINAILGEDRLLTGPEAGITRDAIAVRTDWGDLPVRIFDTAGMRRRSRIEDKVEKLSVADALRAVRFAEVVVVLIDAERPFETQDLRIADLAAEEGRAVVIAVNKWDLIEDKAERLAEMREAVERLLPQLKGVELVTVSARTGRGLDRLRAAIARAYEVWNRRIPTGPLNRWLSAVTEAHPPPAPKGRRIKLRYITQARTRPPGFVVMCSRPEELPDAYRRYLVNALREDFDLPGTPVRMTFRSQAEKNPYRNRRRPQPSRLRKHLHPKAERSAPKRRR